MRLRLFERLGRLVSWRFGSRSGSNGRSGAPRAADAEASGRHRKNAGQARQPNRAVTGSGAPEPAAHALQPPAGLPRRAPQSAPGRQPAGPAPRIVAARPGAPAMPPLPRNYAPGAGGGIGRARIREAPFGAAPLDTASPRASDDAAAPSASVRASQAAPRQPWYQVVGGPPAARRMARQEGLAATRNGTSAAQSQAPQAQQAAVPGADPRALLPLATAHPQGHPVTADGRRNCGPLEKILWRQWDAATAAPPPQLVAAIDRLAELPRELQQKLADGLDGIFVGEGGVPDLDDMAALHGVPLPSGKATWDACAGAYGDRKIVVGTRPSPTPDVICHEIGHALDDLDSPPGKWQSDSPEFRHIYDQCQAYIASDFHRQRGGLGRKEFFADAFAAIASAQRPALVDMLSGNTRIALRVMLYFNKRYGI